MDFTNKYICGRHNYIKQMEIKMYKSQIPHKRISKKGACISFFIRMSSEVGLQRLHQSNNQKLLQSWRVPISGMDVSLVSHIHYSTPLYQLLITPSIIMIYISTVGPVYVFHMKLHDTNDKNA